MEWHILMTFVGFLVSCFLWWLVEHFFYYDFRLKIYLDSDDTNRIASLLSTGPGGEGCLLSGVETVCFSHARRLACRSLWNCQISLMSMVTCNNNNIILSFNIQSDVLQNDYRYSMNG